MDGGLLENTVFMFSLLLCSLANGVLHADIPVSLQMIRSRSEGESPEVTSTTAESDEFDTEGVHMQFQNGE